MSAQPTPRNGSDSSGKGLPGQVQAEVGFLKKAADDLPSRVPLLIQEGIRYYTEEYRDKTQSIPSSYPSIPTSGMVLDQLQWAYEIIDKGLTKRIGHSYYNIHRFVFKNVIDFGTKEADGFI